MQLSTETKQKIQKLKGQPKVKENIHKLFHFWANLKLDEQMLLQILNGQRPASAEHPHVLYILNNEIDLESYNVLKEYGMPDSEISNEQWQKINAFDWSGYVGEDGSLYQDSPYAGFDPGWAEAVILYKYYCIFPEEIASFQTTPNILSVPDNVPLNIAIMGDWGTGQYNDFGFSSPSSLIGEAISNLQPDITIHLGDVYYAGRDNEESANLLESFPAGSLASFTMNSNHEMYDGANGYFGTALANALFATQKNTSYFAITYNDWVIIGLDSAYYDTSSLYMQGALTDPNQLAFIESLNITDDQKIILLTHHVAMDYNGAQINEPLFSQVFAALGNRYPDYWYYGHIHNGVVYNNSSVQRNYICPSGLPTQLRCFGHGAIPIGNAPGLNDGNGPPIAGVDYYAATPMPNPNNDQGLSLRVLNGFAMITLNGTALTEQVYEVSEENGATPVWSNNIV